MEKIYKQLHCKIPKEKLEDAHPWKFIGQSEYEEPTYVPYNPLTCRLFVSRVHSEFLGKSLRKAPYGHPIGIPAFEELDDNRLDAREWIVGSELHESPYPERSVADKGGTWPA